MLLQPLPPCRRLIDAAMPRHAGRAAVRSLIAAACCCHIRLDVQRHMITPPLGSYFAVTAAEMFRQAAAIAAMPPFSSMPFLAAATFTPS